MDLSNDLISKFVKITNDDKNKNSESTVYGTVVEYNGGMYVKIDGSDLLTPVETTTDFKPDERVTVMIKNHSATVTGNITSPATNDGDVTKKVTEAVEDVEGKVITEVEILIADRVSTKQLDAEVARIDTLIAGKATIEELEAVDAKIENLEAENLKAINAEIENLKANKAEINDLKATTAEIEILDAKVASIDTLVNGNLTSDNILSFNITSQNTTMENAFIKDAMIDSITANKIMSGVIDTNNVRVQSTDGSLLIQGTLIQMKDEDGKVRIQIGKDTGGNFTFILYDKSGTGVLIDEDGIKSSNAIADGLIVDAKVADNANISGSKLDITSLITEVNNDNSTTIKSNKIYLDEQGQSLEVAFNSLKTQVDTIQDVTIDGDLTSVIEQVQSNTTKIEANKEGISTLVAENTIRKEEIQNLDGEIESVNNTLSSKYSSLEQDVSGFKSTVANTYTTKSEFNNLQIGGTNLMRYSKPYLLNGRTDIWKGNTSWKPDPSFYGGNEDVFWNSMSATASGWAQQAVSWGPDITQGKTYVISFDYLRGTSSEGLEIVIYDQNDSRKETIMNEGSEIPANVVQHREIKWTATYTGKINVCFWNKGSMTEGVNGNILFSSIKIEEGNKATAWSPAPEDVQGQIDDTNTNLKNNYSTTSAMNSAIQQKANEITSSVSSTYATKQSVTDVNNNLTNNYSTTTQMNSAIQQKANEINQTVSETYTTKAEFNNLEVGGTNLMRYSKPYLLNGKSGIWRGNGNISWKPDSPFYGGKEDVFWNSTTSTTGETWAEQVTSWGPDVTQGKTYTISFDYTRGGYSKGLRVDIYDQNDTGRGTLIDEGMDIPSNVVQHREIVWTATYTGKVNLCFWNKGTMTEGATSNVLFSSIKIEEGNKATAWSPAPQDVQGQIDDTNTNLQNNYSTTTQMNSAINQKANEITSSVSSTYATKQSVTDVNNKFSNYSTTTQMNSAIQQKANEINQTVSETYATKQSVTDVNNKFSNYSTTTQMNSAIQQKANEINQTVSSTYATKQSVTDVNNKFNSYTTKSELSQTTDSITAKFTESGGYNLIRNGGFISGMNNWTYDSAYLGRGSSPNTASGYYIDVTQPHQVEGVPFKIIEGKTYIYSARVWYTADTSMGWYSPLNYITTSTSSGTTHEGGFISHVAKSHVTIPKGRWVDIWNVFTCVKTGYYHPYLKHEGITSVVSFADVMIMEGDVYKPWTPHPYEVYDGVTTIDKTGIKVNQSNYGGYTKMSASGFYVNDGSKNVVSVDTNGLYVQGNITSGSTIQGSTIQGSRIIGSEFIGNGTGNRVCINNGDYEVQTGNTTKGFFGLRTLDDDGREIPRIALGSSGLNKNSHNYFAITHYPANNNPLNANQTYADMTYRTHKYTTSDTSGDISNIRMLDDGDIHLAPVRNLLIKSSFSNGSHNSNTDETTLAEFGTFNGDYTRYMETACIKRNGTSKGLILANYNDAGYAATVRLCIDDDNYRFFAPMYDTNNVSLGSPSYLWQRVCASQGTINTSDRNLKDNIEYIQETLNPKARKSESYSIKDMYDFVKDELSMATYTMKNDEEQKLKYGFIAQDIINTKIGENIVYQVNDKEGSFLGYDTMNYTSTLAGALKQAINEIENLKKEMEELKARLVALEHDKEEK